MLWKGGVGKAPLQLILHLPSKLVSELAYWMQTFMALLHPRCWDCKARSLKSNGTQQHKIVPLEAYGMPVMSIGFVVEPEQAVVLRGLASQVYQTISGRYALACAGFLIIDLPPGTGDIQLTCSDRATDRAILVTTPQELAVIDAEGDEYVYA